MPPRRPSDNKVGVAGWQDTTEQRPDGTRTLKNPVTQGNRVIEQPEVRRWYARMLMDRAASGDRDKARGLLAEALAAYREIGMPRHQAMAEELLSRM